MATRSSSVRYASRNAVYGSNAYDLSKVRSAMPAPLEPELLPVRKPEIRPAVSPAPRTAPKTTPTATPRTSHKSQRSYGVSLYAAAGFVVAVVLIVFVLLAHVRYTEVTNDTVKLQSQLTKLNEQERKLKISYENAFDVNQVEQYATQKLGMSKPTESQIGTISATAKDKAVVADGQNNPGKTKENMGTFLASLVAYFK